MKKIFTKSTILFILLATSISLLAKDSPTYSGGSGTSGDPYQIATLDDLKDLSGNAEHWGLHFIQTADIVWPASVPVSVGVQYSSSETVNGAESFSPIGNSETKFTGSYNGQKHTISNLYINRSATDDIGLFGFLSDARITDISLADIDYTGANQVGGLAGQIEGNTEISGCTISGNNTINGVTNVGGFIGRSNTSGNISDCHVSGTVSADNSSGANFVGGFVGEKGGTGTISECSTSGIVNGNGRNHGGFVGWMDNGQIRRCYSTMALVNTGETQGRIAGFVGGLANFGGTSGQIYNCYATGNVTADNTSNNTAGWGIGGFVGSYYAADQNKIYNSYSTGAVRATSAENYVGGFSGEEFNDGDGAIDCFWNVTTSGQASSAESGSGETGKDSTAMTTKSTFTDAGWDFTAPIWSMDQLGTVNSGYPILNWQDNVAPEIQCNAQNIYLGEDGTYILSPAEIRAFASGTTDNADDFDDLDITVSRRGFNCSQVGENLDAKVIVTDQAGNQSSCWADIRVYPPTSYKIDTVADVEVVAEAGECGTQITYPDFINDNCASLTQIAGVGPDSIFPVGTTTESWELANATGGIDTITFNVIVSTTNAVPTIDSVADVDATEDAAISVELTGISTGNDCEEQLATVTVESSNEDLIDSLSLDYTQGDTTATLAATLVPDASGTAEITVTVEDELEATVSKTFTLTVSAVNDAPYLITPIPDQTINASYILKVPVSPVAGDVFGDIDNDNLTLNIIEEGTDTLPGWATFVNDTLLCQPLIADTGCVNIVVEASDGELTATDTFQVCVEGYPTSINELGAGQFEVNLYPNPTRGMVNIDVESSSISDVELTVLNITGQQVLRKQYRAAERITFDMSNRVSGMYFVKLDFKGKQVLKKLIVDRK